MHKIPYKCYVVTTDFNPCLHELYSAFYTNGIKHIPFTILDKFTTESLAYWFMDDGYLNISKKDKSFRFCTDSFKYDELVQLCTFLLNKFNLHFTIIKRFNNNKVYHRLRLSSKDNYRFINLVKPYINKDLQYKIGLVTP